jgi:hypothetical protein
MDGGTLVGEGREWNGWFIWPRKGRMGLLMPGRETDRLGSWSQLGLKLVRGWIGVSGES